MNKLLNNLFSNSTFQSGIWLLILLILLIIFKLVDWYNIWMFLFLLFLGFFVIRAGADNAKRIIKNQILGVFIGGFIGTVVFTVITIFLFKLMLSMSF